MPGTVTIENETTLDNSPQPHPLGDLIPRFILCSPLVPPPADCWCRGLVEVACYEVECDAWAPRPRGAQAWGAHTCRPVPRPTYTTPQHLRIQGTGSSSSSLPSRRLGNKPTAWCLGGRPREGVAHPARDFETRYQSPPR